MLASPSISPLEPQDVQQALGLQNEEGDTFWLSWPNTPNIFGIKLSGEGNALYGFCIAQHVFDEVEILSIVVKKALREKGYGHKLLHNIFDIAHSKGATNVFLEVRPTNIPAISFYKKHGFKHIATRRHYYKNGDDALIFKHILQQAST